MNCWNQAPFFRILVPYTAGIVLCMSVDAEAGLLFYPVAFLFFLTGLFVFWKKVYEDYKYRWVYGLLLNLLLIGMGYSLTSLHTEKFNESHFSGFIRRTTMFRCHLTEPPTEKKATFKTILQVEAAAVNSQWIPATGKVLAYFRKSSSVSDLKYGERVIVHNVFKDTPPPKHSGEFDYKSYLAFRGIYHQAFIDSNAWSTIPGSGGYAVLQFAYGIREKIFATLKENGMKDNVYGVASALLIGSTDNIDRHLKDAYSATGTIHVLAVSGSHVAIIYFVLNMLFAFFEKLRYGKILKGLNLLLFLWLYALITGLSPSALRATVMISFIVLGEMLQRNHNVYNTLCASAFLLLSFNPFMITDAGFQLSYLAVAGIVFFHEKIYSLWKPRYCIMDYVWALMCMSVAAQIATFPLSLFYFHRFPVYFILTNLIVVPVSTVLVYAGALLVIFSSVTFIAFPLAKSLNIMLEWLNNTVLFLAGLPFASLGEVSISVPCMLLLFVLTGTLILFLKKFRARWLIASLATLLVLLLLQVNAQAQDTTVRSEKYPWQYFRSPLDIPLMLSGSFGEFRKNHFHSGLDIKTDSVEGKNVYAVADGYVSRIRVSATGYGHALYITHPNGYVSVYAHLKQYNQAIGDYIKKIQYQKESFEVDTMLRPDVLPVTKNEVVALSGNTGGSEAPHLHFEIRDKKTEAVINPLFFGLDVPDTTPPVMLKLVIYPQDETSAVNNQNAALHITLEGNAGHYAPVAKMPYLLHGRIGFGIEVFDRQNEQGNKNGIYALELRIDGKRIYYHCLERFLFEETRYVNSMINYEALLKQNEFISACFVSPNNKMNVFNGVINRGIALFDDQMPHRIEIIASDARNNISTATLEVQSTTTTYTPPHNALTGSPYAAIIPYGKSFTFRTEDIVIAFPENALYDTLRFLYNRETGDERFYSALHRVHNPYTPLHSALTISLNAYSIPPALHNKTLIVSIEDDGTLRAQGGKWKDGVVTAKIRALGTYAIMLDTVPPQITPLPASHANNTQEPETLALKIEDSLSGIKSYYATLDGKWILMEFDGKTGELHYIYEGAPDRQLHRLSLRVTDGCGNTQEYHTTFTR